MNLVKKSLLIGLTLPLSACISMDPDFKQPAPELTDKWSQPITTETSAPDAIELKASSSSATQQEEWWKVFKDPILDQLVETALQQNKSLEIAGLRILEAQAQLGIATGNLYPQAQVLQGAATRVSPANGGKNFSSYSLGVAASWEIDFWGRFDSAIKSADASFMSSVAARNEAIVILAAQVVDTYAVIRITEEQLRIANENEILQQRSYEIASVLYRNGSDSELDVEQAKTLLLSTQSTIPGFKISLVKARNAMSILLGKPPGAVEKIINKDKPIPNLPAQVEIGIPADLLRQRPDVQQAEYLAMAQNSLVGVAEAALYPSFSLTGSVGLSAGGVGAGSSSFGDLFEHDALSYSFGPSFVWPFLNYERIVNNVRVQDARLQQALVNYQQTVIQAAREVEDEVATLNGTQEQVGLLMQTVESAKRSNVLSTLQYKEGLSDYQRVLDAQRALFSQQQNLVNAEGSRARSLIALFKALGGGWQQQSDRPIISDESINQMNDRTNWGDFLEPENLTATDK